MLIDNPMDSRIVVGAGEACDLLIFRSRLNGLGRDRSLASLDSTYGCCVGFYFAENFNTIVWV